MRGNWIGFGLAPAARHYGTSQEKMLGYCGRSTQLGLKWRQDTSQPSQKVCRGSLGVPPLDWKGFKKTAARSLWISHPPAFTVPLFVDVSSRAANRGVAFGPADGLCTSFCIALCTASRRSRPSPSASPWKRPRFGTAVGVALFASSKGLVALLLVQVRVGQGLPGWFGGRPRLQLQTWPHPHWSPRRSRQIRQSSGANLGLAGCRCRSCRRARWCAPPRSSHSRRRWALRARVWGPTPPQLVRAVLVPDPPVLARLRWPPSLAAAFLELLALASVAPAPREQRQPGSGRSPV